MVKTTTSSELAPKKSATPSMSKPQGLSPSEKVAQALANTPKKSTKTTSTIKIMKLFIEGEIIGVTFLNAGNESQHLKGVGDYFASDGNPFQIGLKQYCFVGETADPRYRDRITFAGLRKMGM
jgi:hypothetical protein